MKEEQLEKFKPLDRIEYKLDKLIYEDIFNFFYFLGLSLTILYLVGWNHSILIQSTKPPIYFLVISMGVTFVGILIRIIMVNATYKKYFKTEPKNTISIIGSWAEHHTILFIVGLVLLWFFSMFLGYWLGS